MKNKELAQIFYEISEYSEIKGELVFKSIAYQKAALSLDALGENVEDIYTRGGKKALEKIPGVGKNIAEKIEEYLNKGKIKYYEDLKKKTPVKVYELTRVEGLGPKRIKALYQKLKIKNLKDLEKAAKSHKISPVFGFGEKTEKNILESIEFLKRSKGRFLLCDALSIVKEIEKHFQRLKKIQKMSVAGSVRRKKETVGDVDLLVAIKEAKSAVLTKVLANEIMDFFVNLPGRVKILGKGLTKSSIKLKQGLNIDLRIVPEKSYGSALQYFTGSKDHNIATRKIAISRGLKLNEYGVFRGEKRIAGRNEKEVYQAIGLSYIEPEMRENQGEIERALEKSLPKVISYQDIKGDLHCHSDWNGGVDSIAEMAQTAQNMGYEYIGITDHTQFLKIERGLNEKQLAQQRKEIDQLNKKFQNSGLEFQILQGAETNILNDGSIDIKDEALKKLDYVIAGVHSGLKMSKDKMTERMIKAMKNPHINIISHPTGRILKKRDEYEIDFDKILKAAKEFNIILEINSCPERLDLNGQNIREAKKAGVKMVINTDAHQKNHMCYMEFGIAQARRGWAEEKDIINTQHLKELLKYFNR